MLETMYKKININKTVFLSKSLMFHIKAHRKLVAVIVWHLLQILQSHWAVPAALHILADHGRSCGSNTAGEHAGLHLFLV